MQANYISTKKYIQGFNFFLIKCSYSKKLVRTYAKPPLLRGLGGSERLECLIYRCDCVSPISIIK